jgi:phosphoglycolate phosphatase-like HAD superfamily hydrolase
MPTPAYMSPIALLWDIDGTLLNTQGVAARQLMASFKEITGRECSIRSGQYSGFTDYEIVFDLLQKADEEVEVSTAEAVLIHYGTRLLPELEKTPPKLLADVRMAFQELADFPNVQHFIGSGNSIRGAESKIAAAGLTQYFPGKNYFIATSTQISRDSVIQSAAVNIKMPTLVIGDSDRDIHSARNSNLSVLAVATGHHSYLELRKLNPDYLLDNSWTTVDLLEIISDFAKKN